MKILVLGVSGMLGNAVFRCLSQNKEFDVVGTARSRAAEGFFIEKGHKNILWDFSIENDDSLARALEELKPEVVINCIGLIKQLADVSDPLITIPINSLLPHRLARHCDEVGAKFVHVSTDCVFSGRKGNYLESDFCDADDLYGRSKLLGEVVSSNAITLRTSIIGHELLGSHALVDWFLTQEKQVQGYKKAIFSGLPTIQLAKIIMNFVLPNSELSGLFHVAAAPISKFDLLTLIAKVYGKNISIIPDEAVVINRSLNAAKFNGITGYCPPSWPELIAEMHDFN